MSKKAKKKVRTIGFEKRPVKEETGTGWLGSRSFAGSTISTEHESYWTTGAQRPTA